MISTGKEEEAKNDMPGRVWSTSALLEPGEVSILHQEPIIILLTAPDFNPFIILI